MENQYTRLNVNARSTADLKYNGDGKFSVSQKIFDELNLSENGFIVLQDPNGRIAFKQVDNEDADIMKSATNRNFNNKTLGKYLEERYPNCSEFSLVEGYVSDVYELSERRSEQSDSQQESDSQQRLYDENPQQTVNNTENQIV